MPLASEASLRTLRRPAPALRERLIALLGGAVTALIDARRRSPLAGLVGAAAALRGIRQPTLPQRVASDGVEQRRTVLIQRSRQEIYSQLRNLEHLPRYLDHLTGVTVDVRGDARFIATVGTASIEWTAQLVEDVAGEKIAWESLPGADVIAGGSYTLSDGPRGGTVVDLELWYRPAMGVQVREPVLRLFERVTGRRTAANLLLLRQLVDRGDLIERGAPANENAPGSGRAIVGPWPHSGAPANV
jgi:uncharacterized membrane protein